MNRTLIACGILAILSMAIGCGKADPTPAATDASKQGKFDSPRKKTNL